MIVIYPRYLILLISVILSNCTNLETQNTQKFYSNKIEHLLTLSDNNKLELSHRLQLVDSAYQITKENILDTIALKIIYKKSNLHFKLKQIDSSYYYDKQLFKRAKEFENDYYIGKVSQDLAYYFINRTIYDSAYYYYNISKNSFQNLKNNSQIGRRLMVMGQIQQNRSDFFGSKETITEALQYLNPEKDKKYIAICYNTMATNHRKLFNYPDAIKYYSKAIITSYSEKDKLIYQNNLAVTYIDNEQYNNAISQLQDITTNPILTNKKKEYARVLDNLAYARLLSRKNTKPIAFLEPLRIRKKNNDKRGQIASYTHLGEFYSKTNPKRAASYFDSVIQLSKTIKMPRAEKDVLTFLMQLQPKNATFKDRYIFLQDSLYTQELKVKTQFAKYKYDDKLKQKNILRLEKEKVEKELKVAQQRNQITYISFGLGFLALVSGFILYFFKQRTKHLKEEKKTETLEAIYETEAELSRRLHDDHGGKLNHTMLLVQNNADKSLVLDNLELLYNQSRDFSREINDIDTGPNYKEELINMLGSRKLRNTKLFITGLKQIDWLPVPTLTKTTLFKVLQELMINMGKHSEAKQVSITFKKTSKTLQIKYDDDGLGASQKNLNTKNGLRNTEKRIEAINGTIIFDSEKGNGFRAEIHIPN